MTGRLDDLIRFYEALSFLENALGGDRCLGASVGGRTWPRRGVYFFFERGESRSSSGDGLRVVRVGTHALTSNSKSTFWNRLSQHRGTLRSGGGNHRSSIFRLLVGAAIKRRDGEHLPLSWGRGSDSRGVAEDLGVSRLEVLQAEEPLEVEVSIHIREMSFLWLALDDPPGAGSGRGFIERNTISLLSNFARDHKLDAPSSTWLGLYSDRERVRQSGLWNNRHVDETYDPRFLDVFESILHKL